MRSKRNHWGILTLTTCVSLSVSLTGCRTGKSNLFSFRSKPSPEVLAGSGPTTTYPAPPSQAATPEAIASVAGGTGVSPTSPVTPGNVAGPAAQVAGLGGSPSYVKPASTNMSAAQANGFLGGAKAAGYQSPSGSAPSIDGIVPPQVTAPKTGSPGYEFGTNPTAKPAANASSYTIPSSYSVPTARSSAPAAGQVATAGGANGFALPTELGGAVKTAGGATDGCTDCAGCAACKSAASESSAAITASAPSSEGGYSPGSTGQSTGYPVGSTYLR